MISQLSQSYQLGLAKTPSQFIVPSLFSPDILNAFKMSQLSPHLTYQPQPRQLYRAGWKLIESPQIAQDSFKSPNINGKRPLESTSDFESIHKKVKSAYGEESTLSDTSTICTSPQVINNQDLIRDEPSLNSLLPSNTNTNIIPKKILTKNMKNIKKAPKMKRILHPCFDREQNMVLFKVEMQTNAGEIQDAYLTRQEILDQDPYSLLYFYEKHLHFTKSTEFNSATLTKL